MDNYTENYFFHYNKELNEKLDECLHNTERQIDRLFSKRTEFHYYGNFGSFSESDNANKNPHSRQANPYSTVTYSQFRKPYIKDFRNFAPPQNDDVKQIFELTGNENIDSVIKYKIWTKESRQSLLDAIQDYYATCHTVRLIKQEENLIKQAKDPQQTIDCQQNLKLIEEQKEQVRNRKDPRIFVPEDRLDPKVDWCNISAKLSKTLHDVNDCRLLWQNQLHWTINNNLWTKEEDDCLLRAVERHGKNDWDSVCKELNSNRLPWQCCARYQQEFAKTGQLAVTQEDANKILDVINLCRIGNFVPWNQVMYFIKFYNLHQVKYQWNKLIADQCSGLPWSQEEDNLLLCCIEKFGLKDWSRIASCIPDRTNKSCRERYVMRLKFEKRSMGKWKTHEDLKLLACVNRFGTNWGPLSSHFSDRNQHQLRNRYVLLTGGQNIRRKGIRHWKIIRDSNGFYVKKPIGTKKLESEKELDQKLSQIFSSYQDIKTNQKSLVCRSRLDESIYQNLIIIVKAFMSADQSPDWDQSMLTKIISKALEKQVIHGGDIVAPCYTTLQGYKAWLVQQEYLSQIVKSDDHVEKYLSSSGYERIRDIVVSLFLWPALLSKLKPCDIEAEQFVNKSIIESDSKNLFKIREIQNYIGSSRS